MLRSLEKHTSGSFWNSLYSSRLKRLSSCSLTVVRVPGIVKEKAQHDRLGRSRNKELRLTNSEGSQRCDGTLRKHKGVVLVEVDDEVHGLGASRERVGQQTAPLRSAGETDLVLVRSDINLQRVELCSSMGEGTSVRLRQRSGRQEVGTYCRCTSGKA